MNDRVEPNSETEQTAKTNSTDQQFSSLDDDADSDAANGQRAEHELQNRSQPPSDPKPAKSVKSGTPNASKSRPTDREGPSS